jgi:Mg2+ and Co2+ transporter CorA
MMEDLSEEERVHERLFLNNPFEGRGEVVGGERGGGQYSQSEESLETPDMGFDLRSSSSLGKDDADHKGRTNGRRAQEGNDGGGGDGGRSLIDWTMLNKYLLKEDNANSSRPMKKEFPSILSIPQEFPDEDLLKLHRENEMRRSLEAADSYYLHSLRSRPITKFQFYSNSSGLHTETTLNGLMSGKLADYMKEGPFWLDICQPDVRDMKMLEDVFGIHPLTTEDILATDTREKCEMYPNYLFLCVRGLSTSFESMTFLEGVNVCFLVTAEFLIVCHEKPVVDSHQIMKRLDKLKLTMTISTDWIMYAILDNMVDVFIPVVNTTELEIDSIDELVLVLSEHEQTDMLRRIWSAKKRVTHLYRLLFTKTDVIKNLAKKGTRFIGSDTILYLRDIQDHVIAMVSNLMHYQDILSRSHSTYLTQIDVEINRVSQRTNNTMKKLTAAAGIALPLSIIPGLFGMNVKVPGAGQNTLAWFFVILSGMLVVGVLGFILGRKHKWF